ncbi:MAG: helix-turn-helix domain-containing protein [Clostridia bacterium]|nr:helix-turn-helix domain-containing protein [Clostridia bacterium]
MFENNTEHKAKVIDIIGVKPTEEAQSSAESEPVFYGTKELAKMFHCSIPTVREIMRREDFPLLIIGGKWLVLKSALEKWAMQKRA